MRILIAFVVSFVLVPDSSTAQNGAYEDPVAGQLVEAARRSRAELGRSINSYTAVIRQRSAAMLRMPLRDRLLAHSESAARVRWSRDGELVVQLLGTRTRDPEGSTAGGWDSGTRVFDPDADRIFLGRFGNLRSSDSEEPWIAHPLAQGAEANYRFRSGDTVRVHLPAGRTIQAVELHVVPRQPSFRYVSGTLLIEPESGALIQAVFRPARNLDVQRDFPDSDETDFLRYVPGFFKPIEVDLDNIVVQYALWDLAHWFPRHMRIDGYVRAGSVRVPFSDELSYEIEHVDAGPGTAEPLRAEEVLASWGWPGVEVRRAREEGTRPVAVARPADPAALLESEELPPPIWEAAPEFASPSELRALVGKLERSVPRAAVPTPVRTRLDWGFGAGADNLLRYNRVEGLSVGLRGVVEHALGDASATVRLGAADLNPNVELALERPSERAGVGLHAYHRLTSTHETDRPLGFGNSVSALVFGRDEGEYYRSTGARVVYVPAARGRLRVRSSAYLERQRSVERETDISLARLLGGADHGFRANLAADAAELGGGTLWLSSWWGVDPDRVQVGAELFGEAASGSHTFGRARMTTRAIVPAGARHRLGMELGGGSSWGELPIQYHWFMGGSETLRGYEPSIMSGRTFVRGRGEIARGAGRVTLALFGDAAWAGESAQFSLDRTLYSAGMGVSLLEGAVRLDVARALRHPRGWTVGLYLDGLL